jgi:hypothetical protein
MKKFKIPELSISIEGYIFGKTSLLFDIKTVYIEVEIGKVTFPSYDIQRQVFMHFLEVIQAKSSWKINCR